MRVNRERIKVRVEVDTVDLDYETIQRAIQILEDLRDRYGADARIEKCTRAYEDRQYLAVMVERDETDAEMAKRIEEAEYWAARSEENDKREFERLKKKFGG